eukprot:7451745-Pyramimonas_sp.AAC.1
MAAQALEQPRAVIFGSRAAAEEVDNWINLILLPDGESDGDILDDIAEVTERWVGRAPARSMAAAPQAHVKWARDMWAHMPRYLHQR